jgi:hypothetical protein
MFTIYVRYLKKTHIKTLREFAYVKVALLALNRDKFTSNLTEKS